MPSIATTLLAEVTNGLLTLRETAPSRCPCVMAVPMLQALGWLAVTLVDKQLLMALLDMLSRLLPADTAQQAQQQVAVHASVTMQLHVWTTLLLKILDTFKESPGTDTQLLEKVLPQCTADRTM